MPMFKVGRTFEYQGRQLRTFALAVVAAAQLAGQVGPGSVERPKSPRVGARKTMQLGVEEYSRTGNDEALKRALIESFRLDPTYPDPLFNLALLAEGHENWSYAVDLLSDALRLSPAGSAIHSSAEQHLASLKAIQNNDSSSDGRRNRMYASAIARATVFLNGGLFQAAVGEAAVAAKIDPNRWEAYTVTADALSRTQQTSAAQNFLGKAIERAPPNVQNELRRRFATELITSGNASLLFSPSDSAVLRAVKTPRGWVIDTADLLFESGKDTLSQAAQARLLAIAAALPKGQTITIRVEGHTDSLEAAQNATALSLRRAEAVQLYLDPTGTQMKTKVTGQGSKIPVRSNDTEAGRQKNRRVELWIE